MKEDEENASAAEELAAEVRRAIAGHGSSPAPASAAPYSRAWEEARRFVVPFVEPGAKLSRVKALLLRLMRVATRPQSTYNARILEGVADLEAAVRWQGEELARQVAALSREVEALRADVRRMSAWAASREVAGGGAAASPERRASAPGLPDLCYASFEDAFRGPEEEVRGRQAKYAEFFRGAPGPVLDCGCGRGEFLELLAAAGVPARGVDANRVLVEIARRKKLDVREGDAFEALGAASGTLGGVAAIQFVEHLAPEAVYDFLRRCREALAPGGRLLLETVNPDSLYAMRAFRLDPSHRWPVPPQTLEWMAGQAGFEERRVEYCAPVPPEEALAETSENDRKLNRWIFGPQDYALFARRGR